MSGGGCYAVCYKVESPLALQIGKLGLMEFEPGHYAYVGSAKVNMQARVDRHARKEKKLRWHVDYFSTCAEHVETYCFFTSQNLECVLAEHLATRCRESSERFGCSDCRCKSHLFCFESPEQMRGALKEFHSPNVRLVLNSGPTP